MGLDMFLSSKVYVGGKYHYIKQRKITVSKEWEKREFHNSYDLPTGNIEYISYSVGYWRKANQVHNWFVKNIQDGNDNCELYRVSEEKLQELLKICKNLYETKDKKMALAALPPCDGFFFGNSSPANSTFWDDYWYDIRHTITTLENALEFNRQYQGTLYYQSSW